MCIRFYLWAKLSTPTSLKRWPVRGQSQTGPQVLMRWKKRKTSADSYMSTCICSLRLQFLCANLYMYTDCSVHTYMYMYRQCTGCVHHSTLMPHTCNSTSYLSTYSHVWSTMDYVLFSWHWTCSFIHCILGWRLWKGRMLAWLPKSKEWDPFQQVNNCNTSQCPY